MSTTRDYYEILELQRSATPEELKRAYRELALRHHPDRVPPEKKREAEDTFKQISEAYAVLSDPQKRALYDQYGHAGVDQKFRQEDIFRGTDFKSVFEGQGDFGFNGGFFENLFGDLGFDFFSARTRRSRGGRGSAGPGGKGVDSEVTMAVTLEEAYRGTERSIAQPRSLTVTIPPGVRDGSRLRIKGEGEPSSRSTGDLYIVVQIQPHPVFHRQGNDLSIELPVSLPRAILGTELSVPTMDGSVTMKIPAGTQSGAIFRLKGKGMPLLRGEGSGDMLAKVIVEIPRTLTDRQRELIQEFDRSMQA
jgi:DnaJ-class molecular chaperone